MPLNRTSSPLAVNYARLKIRRKNFIPGSRGLLVSRKCASIGLFNQANIRRSALFALRSNECQQSIHFQGNVEYKLIRDSLNFQPCL